MSRNHEIAKELAKLASLMAPGGVEDSIGEDDSFQVPDSERPLEIHNHNFNTHRLGQEMGLGSVLPAEDWNPPSLAEVQERARSVYGTQSHNSDFYPKGLDAMDELLQGHSPIVASKRKLNKLSAAGNSEVNLVLDIAKELAKYASSVAPGIEDHIGEPRNQGPNVADRIDSNKGLASVKAVFHHEPLPEVTSYGAPAFEPSMDTGGFEGAMPIQASTDEPVTRRKSAFLNKQAWMSRSVQDFAAALHAAEPPETTINGEFTYVDGRLVLHSDKGESFGVDLSTLMGGRTAQKKTLR